MALLLYLPAVDISFKNAKKVVEVELLPPRPKILPKPPVRNVGSPEKRIKNPLKTVEPSITMPDLDIPAVDTKYDVEIPDVKVSRLNTENEDTDNKKLLNEIQSTRENIDKASSGAGERSNIEAKEYGDSSFFVLENITNNKRKISYIPERPKFSLSNNTKVKVRFKIDKQGNTYGILLVTRSDSTIERLAVDFVEKLKFNSVVYAYNDTAEMTIYFKVR
jgi:outer membrane biosynthesis protein TonB